MLRNSLILETAVAHNNIVGEIIKITGIKSNIHKQSGKTFKTIDKKKKKPRCFNTAFVVCYNIHTAALG